jgi:serine/threonine-protein kinase
VPAMSEPDTRLRQRYEQWIGRSIKKYRIDALLGIGGMAVVFRATHRNGNPVAVKMLHAEHSLDASTRDRFLREGYVANKVAHRGAVRVLDDDVTEEGAAFLVMELLEGETLEARWERCGKKLSVRDVASIGHQLLDVLAAAHEKTIIHRDIKPDNVFLTNDGPIKVLDFGIARIREGGAHWQTRTGALFGTPAFMPPEQALGKREQIDGRTDLWAAAATMFTLLSGHYVPQADTLEELVVFAATRPARLLATVADPMPPPVARVIDRALAFEKADRWPDARSMQEALDRAYEEVFGEPLTTAVAVRVAAEAGGVAIVGGGMRGRREARPQNPAPYASTAAMLGEDESKRTGAVGLSSASGLEAPQGVGEGRRRVPSRERWLAVGAAAVLAVSGFVFLVNRKSPGARGETGSIIATPGTPAITPPDPARPAVPPGETAVAVTTANPNVLPVPSGSSTSMPDAAVTAVQGKPPSAGPHALPAKPSHAAHPPPPPTVSPPPEHDIFKP